MKTKEIGELIGADTISKKGDVYTARWGFFYTNGQSATGKANTVSRRVRGALIVDAGEKWKAFRGGDSVARGSHFWVQFRIDETRAALQNVAELHACY